MDVFWSYLFILCSVAFFYLFVCVDERGKGCLPKTKIFFWIQLPNALKFVGRKTCGDRFVKLIERLAHYICHEPNPFVQIIYFVCAFGGFYVYVTEGFPMIPNSRLDSYHMYVGTVLMIMCYGSYFMACWVDPGQLDKHTSKSDAVRALKRFKFDGVIFEKGQKCRTCDIEKPPRSKHCSMCGFCVEKLDHHCVWINQCVGLHNYKYFLSFLFLHAIICTYGFVAGCQTMLSIIERDKLRELRFKTNDGEVFEASNSVIFSYLMQRHRMFIAVIILCAVVAIMLWLFVGFHLFLINRGYSTNEWSKRSQKAYFIERQINFYTKWADYKREEADF